MIWQEKSQYIIMLANVVEGGKKKCEKYWPDIDSSREYGNVKIYFEKSEVYADYEYRTFEVTCKGKKRIVTQLHFTSWPDHGVPFYPLSLVPFLKKMLTIPQSTAPVVVHCSAGVGRTGTIVSSDICLRMAAREKAVDILRYLHEIREQRANMVDNITCCVFWPGENEEMKPVPNINLKHHKLQAFEYYYVHSVVLDIKSTEESWMVQIVQFKNWKHGSKLPPREEHLVMLWEDTENLSRGNYPMIVTCYDGATASGLFVAMLFVIEKIKLEQQSDPCLAVRVARRNRKQFISNKVQFELLYRSAVIYLSMFETYSNFQPVVNKQNNYFL